MYMYRWVTRRAWGLLCVIGTVLKSILDSTTGMVLVLVVVDVVVDVEVDVVVVAVEVLVDVDVVVLVLVLETGHAGHTAHSIAGASPTVAATPGAGSLHAGAAAPLPRPCHS